ncbi:glia-derived nexin-like [Leucoraja erinacea]|uniref:glia-derived nexin-like n=1 Tax=Leucoraja erinaceus TaxID=7782 RepID=UPI002454408F|nr:glia-derived nexin-like [Leucoraja erinacea]
MNILIVLCVAVGSFPCLLGKPEKSDVGSDLGMKIFDQVAKAQPTENIVMSPHGMVSLLWILQFGADGETRKQLNDVLKYSQHDTYKRLKTVHKSLTASKNEDAVTFATGIFVPSDLVLEKSFIKQCSKIYKAEPTNVNFAESEAAASIINTWANSHTKGMITEIISPSTLDEATKLLVANAIYFKGAWKSKFNAALTNEQDFTGADGNMYRVPMMFRSSKFMLAVCFCHTTVFHTLNREISCCTRNLSSNFEMICFCFIGTASTPNEVKYDVLQLPYNGAACMFFILPTDRKTALTEITPHINVNSIKEWKKIMELMKADVTIPRFTAESETNLEKLLVPLGITNIFEPDTANFKKLTKGLGLYVSQILHKAKIEVNEEGTEASGMSAAMFMLKSLPPQFTANRPFLYMIWHETTALDNIQYFVAGCESFIRELFLDCSEYVHMPQNLWVHKGHD